MFLQALKLSDDLNLNEINCVCLLVSANTEVNSIFPFFIFYYENKYMQTIPLTEVIQQKLIKILQI
jgi:hypothetical protein